MARAKRILSWATRPHRPWCHPDGVDGCVCGVTRMLDEIDELRRELGRLRRIVRKLKAEIT